MILFHYLTVPFLEFSGTLYLVRYPISVSSEFDQTIIVAHYQVITINMQMKHCIKYAKMRVLTDAYSPVKRSLDGVFKSY